MFEEIEQRFSTTPIPILGKEVAIYHPQPPLWRGYYWNSLFLNLGCFRACIWDAEVGQFWPVLNSATLSKIVE